MINNNRSGKGKTITKGGNRMLIYNPKNLFLLLTVIFCLILSSYAIADGLKVYQCYRMMEEPVLDGKADDLIWSTIPAEVGFVNISTGVFTIKQSFFKMGYDDNALYIFMRCEEPDMRKINAKLGDMRDLWTEDSVEVFLQPEGNEAYFQFVVNAIGSRWNGRYVNGKNTESKLGDWKAMVYRGSDYWNLEVKIPFDYLGIKPVGEWRGNIGRNIRTTQELTTWSPMKGRFHDTTRFGRIIFIDQFLKSDQAREVEKKANQAVYNSIESEISELIMELYSWQLFFKESSKTRRNRDAVRIIDKIDIIKVKSDTSERSLGEKVLFLHELKNLHKEANELRSKLLLEEMFSMAQ